HDAFDHHQPDSQATLLGGDERFEQHGLLLRRYALATIGHVHEQPPAAFLNVHLEATAFGHGLQRIGEQAVEYLPEQHAMAYHPRRLDLVEDHADVGLLELL